MATGVVATPLLLYTNLEYATLVGLAATFFILCTELLALQWGIRLPFWSAQLARTRRPEESFSWASIGFLLTLLLLVWVAPIPVALAAAGMLAFGDGFSALVGRAVGRHRIPYNRRKTWEGSLAGFLAGLAGALVLLHWYAAATGNAYAGPSLLLACTIGSAFAMFAESLPRFQDNVTVPLFAGASMWVAWFALGLEPMAGELFVRLGVA